MSSWVGRPRCPECGHNAAVLTRCRGRNLRYIRQAFQVKVNAKNLVVSINISQAATATITGPGLRKTVKALAVGTHKVTVPLTRKGEAERREAKTIKVTVSLQTSSRTVSATEKVKL